MAITPQLGAEITGRRLVIAKQTGFGVRAPTGSGQVYARSDMSLDLQKELITSDEVRQSRGIVTRRHGAKTAEASFNGDLRPGLLTPFMASILGGTAAATTPSNASAGDGLTIATNAGVSTITREAGAGQSFLTDERYEGEVINSSLFGGNNRVVSVSATELVLADEVADVATPDESATITSANKLGTPSVWPAREFYTIEDQFTDIGVSFVAQDLMLTNVTLSSGDSDIVDVALAFIGGEWERLSSPHFTNPTAELANEACGTEGMLLRVHGRDIGTSQFTLNMDNPDAETLRSAGQNGILTAGRGKSFDVSGSWTGHFYDGKYAQAYDEEIEDDFAILFESIGTTPKPFVSFASSRCKVNDFNPTDQTNIVTSHEFTLQEQVAAVSGLPTGTITYQDSGA